MLPWGYVVASVSSLAIFARSKSFAFLRTAQLLLILVVPALLTVALGGLDPSSDVILWSLLAPLGAVAFDRPSKAWPWFAAFVALLLLAVGISEVVRPDGADLPAGLVRVFDVLNIVAVMAFAAFVRTARHGPDRDQKAAHAVDPVCGMQVERAQAPATLAAGDELVYFCSTRCRERFQAHRDEDA